MHLIGRGGIPKSNLRVKKHKLILRRMNITGPGSGAIQGDTACKKLESAPISTVSRALPVTDEQRRNGINVIPPEFRPRVVLRYADSKDLLVSGLLDGGTEIAQHPAVVDVPLDRGHVVLFSNNPVWRAETHGSYFLVFNAILNFDNLNAGRKLDEK